MFILVILCSCQTPASYSNLELNFDHLNKIIINANYFEIISSYETPLKKPNIDRLYEEPIVQLTARYFKYKFIPNGLDRRLRVVIKEASLKKTLIEERSKKFNFENLIKIKPNILYTAKLKIDIEIRNTRGFVDKKISTSVFFEKTSLDNLSINENSIVYFEIYENIILLLDDEVNKQIEKYFQKYLI